jgi:hypothetical protein
MRSFSEPVTEKTLFFRKQPLISIERKNTPPQIFDMLFLHI